MESNFNNKRVFYPIVFHFHQPVDNFGWVYEESYEKSYYPLVNAFYNNPEIKVNFHFTGALLQWLIKNKPDFTKMIKNMVARGQLELLSGGFYEPIFAIIPEEDRIAQMKKLNELIKTEFNYSAKGAWLSERVWEPNYPTFFAKVGLNYIIVDDNHLRSCGMEEQDTFYSYTTEDSGNIIRVFPINEPLRYLSPWKPSYEVINYLEQNASADGDRVILFLSDAEKMGVWGTTHELCYIKGHDQENGTPYIQALIEGLNKNKVIQTITISEYIEKYNAKSLIYFPTASYDKMEEWVLPTKTRRKMEHLHEEIKNHNIPQNISELIAPFIKGGFWRYFLVKYPESNNMHKKMLWVRKKLVELEKKLESIIDGKNTKIQHINSNINTNENANIDKKSTEIIKELIKYSWDEIYRAQCNDCYWHGQFGGVYLHFLRHAVYMHLINVEKSIDKVESIIQNLNRRKDKSFKDHENGKNEEFLSVIKVIDYDFDFDSAPELLIEHPLVNLYIKPNDGGTIFELDLKEFSYNLLNTLTRWEEAYHLGDKKKISHNILVKRSIEKHAANNENDKNNNKNNNKNNKNELIVLDNLRKSALRDYIITDDTEDEMLLQGIVDDKSALSNKKYDYNLIKSDINEKQEKDIETIELSCSGKINSSEISNQDAETIEFSISKYLNINTNDENEFSINVLYSFNSNNNKNNNNRSELWNRYHLLIEFPFILSGDPNLFKCYSDIKKFEIFEPLIVKKNNHNSITFEDPLNKLKITFNVSISKENLIEQTSTSKHVEQINNEEDYHLSLIKYPIMCFARTNNGYKEIYQGLNLLIRTQLNALIRNNLKISCIFSKLN